MFGLAVLVSLIALDAVPKPFRPSLGCLPCEHKTANINVTVVKKSLGRPAGAPSRPTSMLHCNLQGRMALRAPKLEEFDLFYPPSPRGRLGAFQHFNLDVFAAFRMIICRAEPRRPTSSLYCKLLLPPAPQGSSAASTRLLLPPGCRFHQAAEARDHVRPSAGRPRRASASSWISAVTNTNQSINWRIV